MRTLEILALSIVLAGVCSSCTSTTPEGSPASWARDEQGVVLNRIPGTESIDIPKGLPPNRVLDAVEMALAGTKPGERNNAWVSQWRPELRDPQNRWIRIGLSVRQHYLCVCYRIEGNRLIPDVPTSKNLKQDGIRIHRKVPLWINDLNPLISMQLYGMVNGTNCSGVKPEKAVGGRFCEHCGAKISATAKFCGDCGKKATALTLP